MSQRQRKRAIAQGLRNLRARPGLDPAKFQAPSTADRIRSSMEDDRVAEVLRQAAACEACARLRTAGDAGALCPEHFRAAVGIRG